MALSSSIDCELIRLNSNESVETPKLKEIGDKILAAWKDQGYCILKNTGLPERYRELGLWTRADEFFRLPYNAREKADLDREGSFSGHIHGERVANLMFPPEERKNKINDIKMVLNYSPGSSEAFPEAMPMLKTIMHKTWTESAQVAFDIGKCLGLAFKQDVEYFNQHCHGTVKAEDVSNILRIAVYPPTEPFDVKESQMRCSTHTDFVLWTLINQDMGGGLQVQSPHGAWLEPTLEDQDDVIFIPGTLMEVWTQNEIMATLHKVDIPPEGDMRRRKTRRSTIYFHAPENKCVIPFASKQLTYKEYFTGLYRAVVLDS